MKVILEVNIFSVFINHQTTLSCIKNLHKLLINREYNEKLNQKTWKIRSRFIKTACLLKITRHRYENLRTSLHKNVFFIGFKYNIKNVKERGIPGKGSANDGHQKAHLDQRTSYLGKEKIHGKKFREVYDFNAVKIKLSNDIESNPGPNNPVKDLIVNKKNFFVGTYNLQGCGNFKKLKRVMSSFNSLPFKNNCVLNLQETHWTKKNDIQYHWKNGNIQSNSATNKCGVAILYNESFFDEILDKYTDTEGRMCSLVAQKDDETYFFNMISLNLQLLYNIAYI